MFPAVANGTYDVVFGDTNVLSNRASLVDFTQPFLTTGYSVAARTPPVPRIDVWGSFRPLSPGVWLLMALFFAFGAHVIFVLERKSDIVIGKGFVRTEYLGGIMDSLSFAFTSPWVPGYADINLRRPISRIFLFIWLAGIYIILAAYSGNLVSFLTASRLARGIEGLDDLTNRRIGVWDDGGVNQNPANWVRGLGFSEVVSVETTPAGIEGLMNRTYDGYLDFTPYLEGQVAVTCGVRIVGLEYERADWAWGVNKALPEIRDALTRGILNITESRLAQETYSRIITLEGANSTRLPCKDGDGVTVVPTPVLDMLTFTPIYVFHLALSIIVVLCHFIQRYFKTKDAREALRPRPPLDSKKRYGED